jgi:hypothetical protein
LRPSYPEGISEGNFVLLTKPPLIVSRTKVLRKNWRIYGRRRLRIDHKRVYSCP